MSKKYVLREFVLSYTNRNQFARISKTMYKSTREKEKVRFAYSDRATRTIAFEFDNEETADMVSEYISKLAIEHGFQTSINKLNNESEEEE